MEGGFSVPEIGLQSLIVLSLRNFHNPINFNEKNQ